MALAVLVLGNVVVIVLEAMVVSINYFGSIATEATVSRHIDDMVTNGLVERRLDAGDRRRMFLIPTRRLEGIGHEFEQARLRIMREHGFIWNGGNKAG